MGSWMAESRGTLRPSGWNHPAAQVKPTLTSGTSSASTSSTRGGPREVPTDNHEAWNETHAGSV
jgi:hypothetical protein